MADPRDPDGFIPLAPHSFQILLSLLEEDRHGYSIIKDIQERTDGRTVLGTSTVYAAIKRMAADGIIEEVPNPGEEASGGPRRRYFRITGFGRRVAWAEGRRINELSEMVAGSSLMKGRPPSAGEMST